MSATPRAACRQTCDCTAHRARPPAGAGWWSLLLPILACALCPACVTTYAKLFAVLGVGFGLSETQHVALLVVALAGSLGVSAWRTVRTGRRWPLSVAVVGATAVAIGHAVPSAHLLEWVGVAILLAGGLTEHFRLRRQVRLAAVAT
ncbi:MAG: hypothetical protein KBG48_15080 [Kofleriaceae bacterium]|jgi:hypothetical protein|nr:hypothetical protein [Kofleriaceae bacterium]MBP9168718.1 hypothetical protein [Kofleriaceae bacterium]MBP9862414.1 hypothetical protein [Kofleriaceae bacterium]